MSIDMGKHIVSGDSVGAFGRFAGGIVATGKPFGRRFDRAKVKKAIFPLLPGFDLFD